MRNVSISKARNYIESFGVRLDEDINKEPLSHSSDFISFRLTGEQHKLILESLEKWRPWDMWDVSDSYYIWELGNQTPRKAIGLPAFRKGKFEIFLDNRYRG